MPICAHWISAGIIGPLIHAACYLAFLGDRREQLVSAAKPPPERKNRSGSVRVSDRGSGKGLPSRARAQFLWPVSSSGSTYGARRNEGMSFGAGWRHEPARGASVAPRALPARERVDPERWAGVTSGRVTGVDGSGCREGMRWHQRRTDRKLRRLRRGIARRSLTRLPPAHSVGGRGSPLYEPGGVST